MEDTARVHCTNRKEWRKWLRTNHRTKRRVELIFYKKHTKKLSMSTSEAMNEAICWGWIDTTLKRLDKERYIVTYAKRTTKSKWSKATYRRAQQEITAKRMTQAGLQALAWGKKNKTHDHGIPKNPRTPTSLTEALKKHPEAHKNYKKLAPSYKKTYLRWLLRAKRPETRKKRVQEIVTRMKKTRN